MTAIGVLLDDFGVRLVGRCFGVRRVAIRAGAVRGVMRLLRRLGGALFGVDAFAGVAGDVAVPEPPGQRLIQRAQIVERAVAVRAADGEPAVFGFLGDAVLEHHHRGDLEGSAHRVRDVIAFDAQRRLVQTQRIRHVVHGAAACGHVADTAHLAALERLRGVLVGAVHQGLLLAARRHANRHRAAAPVAQPPFELLVAGGFDRHDHLPRHRRDRREEIVAAGLVLPLVAPACSLRPRLRVDGGDGLRDADGIAPSGQHDRRVGRGMTRGTILGTVGGVVISIR